MCSAIGLGIFKFNWLLILFALLFYITHAKTFISQTFAFGQTQCPRKPTTAMLTPVIESALGVGVKSK